MSTIRDVAKSAQVSVATVSRVINKSGYVHPDTVKKVMNVIEELNYKPSSIAVSLNNKKTKTIGLILPDIRNPFFPELSKGIEDLAKESGYTVILCNSDGNIEDELKHIKILEQKYVDGIILASNTLEYSHIQEYSKPIVLLDRTIKEQVSSVSSQNFLGAQLATKHLLEIGCKRIAHICGPKDVMTAKQRLEGYMDIIGNEDWFSNQLIENGDYNIKPAYQATMNLFDKNPDIDGIFAGNDLMAVGCLKALHKLGKSVPEDVALIGFDGIDFTEITIPELSTIAQPIYEMGYVAMKMLIDQMESEQVQKENKLLDVKLVVRDSTKRKGVFTDE
jgi:DNA-binding LacI/PurR family transcriptional regulator